MVVVVNVVEVSSCEDVSDSTEVCTVSVSVTLAVVIVEVEGF